MDCSLPVSSVHGVLQATILEWIAMPSSRGSSRPRDQTCVSHVSCIGRSERGSEVAQLFPTLCDPMDGGYQAPLSMGFSRQEYWSRVTLPSPQETPGVTGKFGLGIRNEAAQRLTEFCQENALVIANTLFQQHKTLHMDITRWSTPKSD